MPRRRPKHPRRCPVLTAWLIAAATEHAAGQLTPGRTYLSLGRTMPCVAEAPAGVEGPVTLRLYDTMDGPEVARADAALGGLDLAGLFPQLAQATAPGVRWVQLFVGGTALGAPLVLQPMLTPERAVAIEPGGRVVFDTDRSAEAASARAASFAGWVATVSRTVDLVTTKGTLSLRLRYDSAPATCRHFLSLVDGGLYTDVVVHRVATGADPDARFVVQAGDPTGTGLGGSGDTVPFERSTLEHGYGVVSLARGPHPDSGDSQFFIGLSREGTRHLDGAYAVFAEVVSGAETLEAIAAVEVDGADRPFDAPVILRAVARPAPPFGEGPSRVEPPAPVAVER